MGFSKSFFYTVITLLVIVTVPAHANADVSELNVGNFSTTSYIRDVNFADENLGTCVLENSSKHGWTTNEEVVELECGNKNIVNLQGVENFTSLTYLDLSLNKIVNISPLAELTSLTILFLGDNQINDISAVSNLLALNELSLRTNQIANLVPLANLVNLRKLYLWQNNISDVSPLAKLTSLTGLWLSLNKITDISPLKDMNQMVDLWLTGNQINDISPLTGMVSLTDLYLHNNNIVDISVLSSFLSLKNLNLAGNNNIICADINDLETQFDAGIITRPDSCASPILISDVNFVDANLASCVLEIATSNNWIKIKDITKLVCGNKNIVNLQGLEKFTSLTYLDLSLNKIVNILPLSGLTSLTILFLGDNQINDISAVSNLLALNELSLRTNQIANLVPLANLVNLRKLYLWQNNISDVSPLAKLTSLTGLWLSLNKITDISPLKDMKQMVDLWLTGNQINDISPLAGMISLTNLYLHNNKIDEIKVLYDLPNLSTINLLGNDNLTCTELDILAAQFGSNSIIRPTQCYSPLITEIDFTDTTLGACVLENANNNGWTKVNQVVELECGHRNISNIQGVENFTALTYLNLSLNKITNVAPLANLTSLTTLFLGDNRISDVSALNNLRALTELSLRTNYISNIAPLADLVSLNKLYLWKNHISNVSPLSKLTSLTKLWLSNNQIKDISPLDSLASITHLYLANNQITDVSALPKLTHLSLVNLQENDNLTCTELDSLDAHFGTGIVLRPESCLQSNEVPQVEYYVSIDNTLRSYILHHFSKNGSLKITKSAKLGKFSLADGIFLYTPRRTGTDKVEVSVMNSNEVLEKLTIKIDVGSVIIEDGYPSKTNSKGELAYGYSAYPGETISWHLNGKTSSEEKLAITTTSGQLVDEVTAIVAPQSISNTEPWKKGFGYAKTFDYTVPENMKSGVYFLAGHKDLFFVVKSKVIKDIVVVIPTNTMNAYSCAGNRNTYGQCWENGNPTKAVPKVSFLRPIRDRRVEYADALGMTLPMLSWLNDEKQEFSDVSYITDFELDDLEYYRNSKLLMILGHNEYWSHKGQKNFDTYIQEYGKNAWIGGGNIMWWASRYEDNDNTLVVFRKNDTEAPSPELRTILFESLGVSIIKSLGGDFDHGGYDHNKMDSFATPNAMKIVQPDSPLFANTEIGICYNIDLSENGEMDGAPIIGFDINGLPVADAEKYDLYRFEILGYAWGYRGGHTAGTMHVLQKTENSGVVVQFGSLGASSHAFMNDTNITYRQIMTNVITTLTSGNSAFSSEVDNAKEVKYPVLLPVLPENLKSFYEQCAR